MGSDEFRFKRFTVRQDGAAMKVGTDGVVLGAWCPLENGPRKVLDIGTGTGLLALMISQRCEAWGCCVDAVEIDHGSCVQAKVNFEASPWSANIHAYCSGIQDFITDGKGYDLVISNPPYFENSLQSPDDGRTMARHTAGLSFPELIGYAEANLTESGAFAVIIPCAAVEKFCRLAEERGLRLNRRLDIFPNSALPAKRSALFLKRTYPAGPWTPEHLIIEDGGRHQYSDGYIDMTRDFYLKF